MSDVYPVPFSGDYPDRDPQPAHDGLPDLQRRPIAIMLGTIGGYSISWPNELAAPRPSPGRGTACCSSRRR